MADEMEEVEQDLRRAIAADIGQMYSEEEGNVVVLNYVVVAECLDSEGHECLRYSVNNTAKFDRVLGWLGWMETITRHKILKGYTKRHGFMTNYVAGFLFDYTDRSDRVALVRKNKPAWQAGKLNAIGGKIEPNEFMIDAMEREFQEETGLFIGTWQHFLSLSGFDYVVHFYRTFGPVDEVRTMEDEEIELHHMHQLSDDDILPNLSWLVPLAYYTHDPYQVIQVNERS